MNSYFTEDSFGSDLPVNWEEIANYLNEIVCSSNILFEDDDTPNLVWENYCNGCYPDAPKPIMKEE